MPKFKVGEKVQSTFTERVGKVIAITERPKEFLERYMYQVEFTFLGLYVYNEWFPESILNKFID